MLSNNLYNRGQSCFNCTRVKFNQLIIINQLLYNQE